MQPKKGVAQVNGAQLHYEISGAGQPLVLIHGNTLDMRMWNDQLQAFSSQYQVIRYEMRGFGKSAPPGEEHYAPADDLQALLTYLGVQRAHILGLSLGGLVAIDFALAYPQMTGTLVAADAGLRDFEWQVYGEFSAAVRATAIEAGVAAARQQWLDGPLFAPALEQSLLAARLRDMVTDYSGWHWLNRDPLREPRLPAIAQLENIDVPTLVIVGERDLPDFRAVAELLHQRIPRSTKLVIPGVGHMSNMEDPARFNASVLDFLAAQAASRK